MALIGKIRRNVGLLVFAIAIAMIAFLLMDVTSSSMRTQQGQVSGYINGEPVDAFRYQQKVDELTNNAQSQGEISDEQRFQIREQAWKQYVQDVLAQKEYDKLGLTVTTDEKREMMATGGVLTHPSLQNVQIFKDDAGKYSPEKLQQYIDNLNSAEPNEQVNSQILSWKRFEESILKDQLKNKYTTLIKNAVYIPKWQVDYDNKYTNTKADIDYVFLPYDNVKDEEISYNDADLNAYLNAHKSEFKVSEGRSIEYVAFPVEASPVDIQEIQKSVADAIGSFKESKDEERFLRMQYSDTPFNNTYLKKSDLKTSLADSLFSVAPGTVLGPIKEDEAYKAIKLIDRKLIPDSVQFRQIFKRYSEAMPVDKAQKLIDSLKTVLDKGGDFEVLASEFSDDGSNQTGGDMGYVKPGSMLAELNDALFYTKKQGDRFTVPTQSGIALVEITNAKPVTEAVKIATLTKYIVPSKATADNVYREASTFVSSNKNLEAFRNGAKEKGYTIKEAKNLDKNAYNVPELGLAQEITTWAFKASKGAVADNVFSVDEKQPDGRIKSKYVVAALTGATNEGIADLESVRSRVETLVKKEKKAAIIKSKISGTDLNAIASSNGTEVKSSANVGFQGFNIEGMGREPKVQSAVLGMNANETSTPIAGDKGVYVVKVKNITPASEAADVAGAKTKIATPIQQQAEFNALDALTKAADVSDERYKNRRF